MNNQRDSLIDFLRGLTIIVMILVHFSALFPQSLKAVIQFFDLAIESFIFLAGYMIGNHYLSKYLINKRTVIKRLLLRSLKLILLQYLLIMTVSFPFYAHFRLTGKDEIFSFIISSLIFLNQVPVLHILPTFIPLFLISPFMLFMLHRNWDAWLFLISLGVFLIGCYDPYVLNIGEKTIFPVILWQIYFVLGSIVGKFMKRDNPTIYAKLLLFAIVLYGFAFFMKYGGYFSVIHTLKAAYNVYPKKFPLNLSGLIYGLAFLSLVYLVMLNSWERIKHYRLFSSIVVLIGRNSLPTFIVHVYLVYAISFLRELGVNHTILSASALISFYLMYKIISKIDKRSSDNRLPAFYRVLFT